MKSLIFFMLFFLVTTQNCYSQNNAPVAVNDTFYVTHNDSIFILQHSGSFNASIPSSLNLLNNDSDPDGNLFFVDTALYNGVGYFSIVTDTVNPTWVRATINYKPGFNFWGIDSVQFVIVDDGLPNLTDTSLIYFFVKRKEYEHLDINNIRARVDHRGLFRDVEDQIASFEVPVGSGSNTIYGSNLWLAGKNVDSVYSNSETFNSQLTYGRSGPIMDSVYYETAFDYVWDRVWKITSNEINYHIINWNTPGYQAIEAIENWPAHGDQSKGQAWNLAPYFDVNSDAFYDPYDGDYPNIKGQQAIYFIYNDMREKYSNRPMRSEVHGMVYVYNCPSDSAIYNTVFLDYTIYNRSNLTYDSTYIGAWTDFDIGQVTDDYVGCDVARGSFYGYNGDNLDEDANGVLGYQAHPPAQSVTFLKGAKQDNDGIDNPLTPIIQDAIDSSGIVYPGLGSGFGDGTTDNEYWGMEHFMYYNYSIPFSMDPQSSKDYYNYLQSKWLDNAHMVWGGNGNAASFGGTILANYAFPENSDPLWYGTKGIVAAPITWSEAGEGNPPADRRSVGSTGPFTFEPDSSISITLAYVFGRDYQTTGNQAGIVVMQERIDSIKSYYITDFVTVCGGALSVPQNKNKTESALTVYPNPFNHEITINYELENNVATLVIYNLIGKKIKSQTITQKTTIIDLSNQPNGIYFVTITDGNNRVSRKVIKN